MLAPHLEIPGINFQSYSSFQFPDNASLRDSGNGSSGCVPATHSGDLDRIPDSWLLSWSISGHREPL